MAGTASTIGRPLTLGADPAKDEDTINCWVDAHPRIMLKRYTERRGMFLQDKLEGGAASRFSAAGDYQKARSNICRHLGRARQPDTSLHSNGSPLPSSRFSSPRPVGGGLGGADSAARAAPSQAAGDRLFAAIHQVFHEQVDAVTSLALARERALLAMASRSGELVICCTDSSSEALHLDGHKAAVVELDFSAGDAYLASGSEDTTVRMWRVENGNCLREFSTGAAVCAVAFHPINSNILLFGDMRRGLACANVSVGKDAARCMSVRDIVSATFDHTGTVVFAATRSANVDVLQLQERHQDTRNWELTLWHAFPVAGTKKTSIESEDFQSGSCRLVYTAWMKEFGGPALMVPWIDRSVRLFSWDSSNMSAECQPSSWKSRFMERRSTALTCRLVLRLPGATKRIPGPVAFCGPGSAFAVCGNADGTLSIMDLKTMRVAENLVAHSQRISALRASNCGSSAGLVSSAVGPASSGDMLASADASGCVILWGASLPADTAGSGKVGTSSEAGTWPLEYDSVAE